MGEALAAAARRAPSQRRRVAALTALVRDRLARAPGVRGARGVAIAWGAGLFAAALVLRRRPDEIDPGLLVARGVRLAAIVACGTAALAVARVPPTGDELPALEALALTRGFRPGAVRAALAVASARAVQRATAVPLVLAALASALVGRGAAWPAAAIAVGTAAWAWLAAGVLGAIAGACRRAAPARGRAAFLAVVVGPWLVADGLLDARDAAWLSVPGWLDWAWHLLVGVRG